MFFIGFIIEEKFWGLFLKLKERKVYIMNKYTFCRPFYNVKRDINKYIVVVIQLIGAFAILNIFLSLLLNIIENKNNMIQDSQNVKFQIYVQDTTFDYDTFDVFEWENEEDVFAQDYLFPFQQTTIEHIKQRCPNCLFSVDVMVELLYLGDLVDDGEVVQICYSSDYTNVRMSKDMEKILIDVNEENTINLKDFPYHIEDNFIKDVNGKKYSIKYIKDKEKTIYLPLEAYYKIYHPKDLKNTTLNIQLKNMLFTDEINAALCGLQEQCGENYQFKIGSDFSVFLVKVLTAERESRFFVFIAAVIICIVLIGMIGIFVMIVKRREREIAILCALGQTKRNVCFGLFMEVFILNMSSYLLGIIISGSIIKSGVSLATVEIVYNIYSLIILLGVALLLSSLVIIPVKILIEKQSPIEILSSL